MRICPLALMSGNTYYCNNYCAFSSDGECLLAAALKEYANATANSKTEKEEPKIQSQFPHDDWDNPTSGRETWRMK